MSKFIIHCVSRATKDNKNFVGDVLETYYGKKEKLIGMYGNHAERFHSIQEVNDYMIKEYGYSRLCDAKRSWIYNNPDVNGPYWDTEVEIIEVAV